MCAAFAAATRCARRACAPPWASVGTALPTKRPHPKKHTIFSNWGPLQIFLDCGVALPGGGGEKTAQAFSKKAFGGVPCGVRGVGAGEKHPETAFFFLGPRLLLVRGAGTPPLCLLLRGIQRGSFFSATFAAGARRRHPQKGCGHPAPPLFFRKGGRVCLRARCFSAACAAPGGKRWVSGCFPPALAPPTARTPCKPLLQRGAA